MRLFLRVLSFPARLVAIVGVGGGCLALLVMALVPASSPLQGSVKLNPYAPPIKLDSLSLPSHVYAANGQVIAVLQNADFRKPVQLAQVPHVVVRAILDVEDRNYFQTGAINVSSIFRALKADLSGGGGLQGGSTITQQLVKKAVLNDKRTLSRKVHGALLAIRLQKQMSKRQILQRYLNTVYFGNGAYGIAAAAYTYFNKTVGQLDASEAALLAGLIENPSYYDPIAHPAHALYRRNLALDEMARNHDLTRAQAAAGKQEPLPKSVQRVSGPPETTFVEDVIHRLLADPRLGPTVAYRQNALFQGGLKIYTTLDPTMQAAAEAAVHNDLPNTDGQFTAALVAVDPSNGEVRALVPGNGDPNEPGFDVITGLGTGAGRQPGSSFKLFTLMAAIQDGYSVNDKVFGTGPCYFNNPGGSPPVYVAHNADPSGDSGIMTITRATYNSVNCAFIRLGLDIGLPQIVQMAHVMGGINLPFPDAPSLIIGGEDVHPINMAAAYATMASGGIYHRPRLIDHVVAPGGHVLIGPPGPGKRVVSATDVQIADTVLQDVLTIGTAAGKGLGRPAAGKTGTTDNYYNAWFDGYTPQLATVVWMGDPKAQVSMSCVGGVCPVYGGTYPAQIWHDFMSAALANQPVQDFAAPPPGSIGPGTYLPPPSSDVTSQHGITVPLTLPPPTTTTTTPPTTTTTTPPPTSTSTSTTRPPPPTTTTTGAPPPSPPTTPPPVTTTTAGPPPSPPGGQGPPGGPPGNGGGGH